MQVCYSSGAYICTLALCALLKQVVIWIFTGFIYCSTEFGASRRSLNFSILGWVQRIVCITWILWKTKYCFKKTNRMNEVFFVFFL